ncbi:hypothetical protein [Botrimarina mediterranea]|uniref:hypothetical protein n=1 Tax=Botrimarina mediterranea TaxID=2528022 RepID=UPI0011A969F0|nr:hypothetical protein [Botrimarina mediterranea]
MSSNIPHSAFRIPLSRRALTLAEVLIAMGLLTLGLLGVAAVFPVGGFYMQSGDIADRGGAVAQAALEDAIIRGHLDPKNWVTIDISAIATTNFNSMPLLEKSLPVKFPTAAGAAVSGGSMPVYRNRIAGGAFVIDPIGMSRALEESSMDAFRRFAGTGIDSRVGRRFPASRGISYQADNWSPWTAGPTNGSDPNGQMWPVRRITTTVPSATAAIQQYNRLGPSAARGFSAADDLALSLPESGDEPAQGLWEQLPGGLASVRQARGEYSWVISVSPSSSPARDALVATPDAHPYEVSAVVFHKRVVGSGNDAALSNERLVRASVVSSNPNGGDLLLERRPVAEDTITTSPFENLRVGQYLMLTGPHPISTPTQPRLVLNWYRVLSIEDSGTVGLSAGSTTLARDTRVLVSLRGPDWPWQPAANLTTPTLLSNDLRVGILPGVVAVHTKTMRLESATEWSIK